MTLVILVAHVSSAPVEDPELIASAILPKSSCLVREPETIDISSNTAWVGEVFLKAVPSCTFNTLLLDESNHKSPTANALPPPSVLGAEEAIW